jgi:hypothetical protein
LQPGRCRRRAPPRGSRSLVTSPAAASDDPTPVVGHPVATTKMFYPGKTLSCCTGVGRRFMQSRGGDRRTRRRRLSGNSPNQEP